MFQFASCTGRDRKRRPKQVAELPPHTDSLVDQRVQPEHPSRSEQSPLNRSTIHLPDREIQKRCKTNPSQIRQQQPRRAAMDAVKR